MDVATIVATTGGSALVTILGGWWTTSRSRAGAREERRRRAAEQIRDAVWSLHDLVWDVLIGEVVRGHRVATAMRAFESLATRYEDLLPDGAGHLRMSTRQAVSHVFGAPAAAALHAQAARSPVGTVDGYWVDVSLTWLEHVAERLHEWEDRPTLRRLTITPYDSWRRDEDEAWHAEQKRANP